MNNSRLKKKKLNQNLGWDEQWNPNRNVLQFHITGMLRAKSRTMRNGNLTLNQQNIRVERPSALHILITYSARYSKNQ